MLKHLYSLIVPSSLFNFLSSVKLCTINFQVTLVEMSKPSPSLPEILSDIGSSMVGVDRTLKGLLEDLTSSNGIQARMDGIMFQQLEGASFASPFLNLIKDYLSSL